MCFSTTDVTIDVLSFTVGRKKIPLKKSPADVAKDCRRKRKRERGEAAMREEAERKVLSRAANPLSKEQLGAAAFRQKAMRARDKAKRTG